jgi:hypothetical protein
MTQHLPSAASIRNGLCAMERPWLGEPIPLGKCWGSSHSVGWQWVLLPGIWNSEPGRVGCRGDKRYCQGLFQSVTCFPPFTWQVCSPSLFHITNRMDHTNITNGIVPHQNWNQHYKCKGPHQNWNHQMAP